MECLLAASWPFTFAVLAEAIKGLEDGAHVRDERLVVTDQPKEGTGCSDFRGYRHELGQ